MDGSETMLGGTESGAVLVRPGGRLAVVTMVGALLASVLVAAPASAERVWLHQGVPSASVSGCSATGSTWSNSSASMGSVPVERGLSYSFSTALSTPRCRGYTLGGNISRVYGVIGARDSSVANKTARIWVTLDGTTVFDKNVKLGNRFSFNADTRGKSQIIVRMNCLASCSGSGYVYPAFSLRAVRPEVFRDVGVAHPFHSGINWASQWGITEGYPAWSSSSAPVDYRPRAAVTRQALVSFLYRYAGEPPQAPGNPGFRDVPANHLFAREITWGVRKGVVSGYGDNSFKPRAPITRQALAAILWRMAGSPAPAWNASSFADVPSNHPFRDPIRWLAGTGITSGYSDGTFRPGEIVTRQTMAQFLQRAWTKGIRG